MQQYPKNFKLVTTFAIILGIMGIFAGIGGAIGIITGPKNMADAFTVELPDQKMQDAQREMMAESIAISERYRVPTGLIALGNLAISLCLLLGGIGTAKLKRSARELLKKTFIAGIGFDVIAGTAGAYIAFETTRATQRMTQAMFAGTPGMNDEMAQMMGGVVSATAWLGVAFAVGWMMLKIWFYVWGRNRLVKADVNEMFAQIGV